MHAPPNPWLALDVTTAPAVRARELRDAWEGFVGSHSGSEPAPEWALVRVPITDSWQRSRDAGVDFSGRHLAPSVADTATASSLWQEHPLAAAGPIIRDCLAATAQEAGHLLVVSDADGLLLSVEGTAHLCGRAADTINFAPGTLWSETGAGTNAVGTALAVGHPVQVFAAEHFNEPVQRWTCSAAPVHDPEDGHLLGVIDLTGDLTVVHPHSLALVMATARAVETFLRCGLQERDERLRARYGDHLRRDPGACALVTAAGRVVAARPDGCPDVTRLELPPGGGDVELPSGARAVAEPVAGGEAYVIRTLDAPGAARRPVLTLGLLGPDAPRAHLDGRRLQLRPRQADLLALLQAAPDGVGAQRLCADLYGDRGRPGSVRVEVSRLRRLLGPCIDAERYRLTCDVRSDVAQVRGLLRRNAARQAAEAFPGSLLPASEAPGVEALRDELEGWLRQVVITSDDADALWAWLQTPPGADDLLCWLRLLRRLAFDDARRGLAAARVKALRTGGPA